MSRERKPNRFGARISSIFNSTDSHHHLEKKLSLGSLRPLSQALLTKKPSASSFLTSQSKERKPADARSSLGDRNSAPGEKLLLSGGVPPLSASSVYSEATLPQATPRLSRRPPPSDFNFTSEAPEPAKADKQEKAPLAAPQLKTPEPHAGHSHKRLEDLSDIIGTLEQEIDQMMGSPNLELTSTALLPRLYLLSPSLPDPVDGLLLKKSPKDFDISRQIKDPAPRPEDSPLRQLHSLRFPSRDNDNIDSSSIPMVRTPNLLRRSTSPEKRETILPYPRGDYMAGYPRSLGSDVTYSNEPDFGLFRVENDHYDHKREFYNDSYALNELNVIAPEGGYGFETNVPLNDATYPDSAQNFDDDSPSRNDNYSFAEKDAMSVASSSEQFFAKEKDLHSSISPSDVHRTISQASSNNMSHGLPSFFHQDIMSDPSKTRSGGFAAPESEVQSLGHDNRNQDQDTQSIDQFDDSSAPLVLRVYRQESVNTHLLGNRFPEHFMGHSQLAQRTHTRMLSTSSIISNSSNKHVSLAALKVTFNFRPGEGERSNYVETIRRNAGTSFNDAGPGNWKLPIGIQPVDKRVMAQLTSLQFNRAKLLASGSRAAKSSGVELKHGHLAPRLLAGEVDDFGDAASKFGDSVSRFGSVSEGKFDASSKFSDSTSKFGDSVTRAGGSTRPISPITSKSSISAGQTFVSRTNSLLETTDVQSLRRGSTASLSDSVGSLIDSKKVDIYYQHPGYKYQDDNTDEKLQMDDDTQADESSDEDEGPRLVLVNPDASFD